VYPSVFRVANLLETIPLCAAWRSPI